jgi:hypothetical protein
MHRRQWDAHTKTKIVLQGRALSTVNEMTQDKRSGIFRPFGRVICGAIVHYDDMRDFGEKGSDHTPDSLFFIVGWHKDYHSGEPACIGLKRRLIHRLLRTVSAVCSGMNWSVI